MNLKRLGIMSEKEHFQIVYDGEGLKSNEMDVRDLAPALLALSDVLEEANKLTYGDKTQVQVNVKGTFKSGSFGIDFSIFQGGINGITSLFDSESANAASNLLAIVGLPGGGLIGFLLWLKNRKIKNIKKKDETTTIVQVEDDEKYETNPRVIALFSNVKVRTSIQKIIVEPLSKNGIDTFTVKKDQTEMTINKEEKEYFKLDEIQDELLQEQERTVFLKVLTISFSEGHKWRFSDGSVEFYANINDENFIQQVQDSIDGFYKNDLLKVLLKERQWISDTGIKSEYEIMEVLEHRSGAKQIKLPFEE